MGRSMVSRMEVQYVWYLGSAAQSFKKKSCVLQQGKHLKFGFKIKTGNGEKPGKTYRSVGRWYPPHRLQPSSACRGCFTEPCFSEHLCYRISVDSELEETRLPGLPSQASPPVGAPSLWFLKAVSLGMPFLPPFSPRSLLCVCLCVS